MAGRHSASRTKSKSKSTSPVVKYGAVGLAALLVVGAGGYFVFDRLGGGGCDSTTEYVVAADPSIAPVLTAVTTEASAEDLGCRSFRIEAASGMDPLGAPGQQGGPDLWIPDSTQWVAKASSGTGTLFDVAATSVAATPVVIAARESEMPFFATWTSALQLPGLRIGDPLTSSVSVAPIVGALWEAAAGTVAADAVPGALVPIAQAQAANMHQTDASARFAAVTADGGIAIATEQQVAAHNQDDASTKLAVTVPNTGAVFLDYPVVATASGTEHADARAAGVALAEVMGTESGRVALSQSGFRGPDRAPLDAGRGVGEATVLTVSDPAATAQVLRRYAVLALPSRALVVEDVSGSMAETAGPDTRIALTVQASETGAMLFPDNAQLGLWAFSIGLGGNGKDYKELAPIRRMDEMVDGVSHRQRMTDAVRMLPSLVKGGTGLYDTTLAAFRNVKEGYDPSAINSVILLTDGANEDPSSISLDELLATLKREQDPARPVIIVTIGITDDADAAVLQKISAATGGTSHIARTPAEIPGVFVDAMRSRATS
ncbi:von Willebrand factor type A domain-containing protein [Rhodococcus sp. AG1013]|uniref:VWA domain-containing protein n=1 Tax=Rhodococcus sp. AG1013 TaxID=2183996 RepID=UPI000E09F5EA|nr:VWA domain-containing protein [Rhodococcus sp. AG1013]RDI20587.1 von Willebrand factor type A domain-containing protein [Rhodococcus sp. AG1013]